MYGPLLSWALSTVHPSAVLAAGSGLVAAGAFVRWRFAEVLMRAEEHVKEGRINEDQVRRRVALARYSGPAMILLGMIAIVVVLW